MKRFTTTLNESLNVKAFGERAELILKDELLTWLKQRSKDFKFYHAIRVPKANVRGKMELDFVLLTKKALIAIEVKYWSGQVTVTKEGSWLQSSRDKVLLHDDAIALNQDKLNALNNYMIHNGIILDTKKCLNWVVWVNDITLDPKIARHPSSVLRENIEQKLEAILPRDHLLKKSLRSIIPASKDKHFPFEDMAEQLDQLPTWDSVVLKDGSVLKGDIEAFSVKLGSGATLDRNHLTSMHSMKRKRFLGMFGTKQGFEVESHHGQKRFVEIENQRQIISVKLAGRKRIVDVPLNSIDYIDLGWKDHSFYGANDLESEVKVGQVKKGKITGIKDFGVFVRLGQYQDGLVHISSMKDTRPKDFNLDQTVQVKVTHINNQSHKNHIYLQIV